MTDMTSVLISVQTYWTAAEALGIGILLFVVGRAIINLISSDDDAAFFDKYDRGEAVEGEDFD